MHPSDSQIERYARRTLGPAELLEVDDHLAACESCRARAAGLAGTADAVSGLGGALLPAGSHLGDEQVAAFVDGSLDARRRSDVQAHLRACADCAREVGELETWARPRRRPRWGVYAAAAAAVLLVVLVPVASRWRSVPAVAGLAALSPDQQQHVRAALEAGMAEPPALLAELGGSPEALMGASPGAAFRLIDPLATVTVSDRPAFRWEARPGTDTYTVAIFDAAMRPVQESAAIAGTSWVPAQPLPRGATYAWQVTAGHGDQSVTAPVPPDPMAKFRVLDAETAAGLRRVARDQPDAHLLLGILYAQAGARAEADQQLAQVPPGDRYFDVARRTRERLGSARGQSR